MEKLKMEWVFLILWTNSGLAVMPEKYPAEQCKKFQDESTKGYVLCIPTPKLTIMKDESKVENWKEGGKETFTEKYKDCTMNGMAMICPPKLTFKPKYQYCTDGGAFLCIRLDDK